MAPGARKGALCSPFPLVASLHSCTVSAILSWHFAEATVSISLIFYVAGHPGIFILSWATPTFLPSYSSLLWDLLWSCTVVKKLWQPCRLFLCWFGSGTRLEPVSCEFSTVLLANIPSGFYRRIFSKPLEQQQNKLQLYSQLFEESPAWVKLRRRLSPESTLNFLDFSTALYCPLKPHDRLRQRLSEAESIVFNQSIE